MSECPGSFGDIEKKALTGLTLKGLKHKICWKFFFFIKQSLLVLLDTVPVPVPYILNLFGILKNFVELFKF